MMNEKRIEEVKWLVSSAAQEWIEFATEAPHPTPTNVVQRLRQDLSAVRTSLVLQQVEFRRRARIRFELADQMFFTDKGLQQATDDKIASYKANEINAVYSSESHGADLCCGIGGDLMQFAEQNKTVGFDLDATSIELARANLRLTNRNHSTAEVANVNSLNVAEFDWWHCDPDRRSEGKRTSQVLHSTPSQPELERLLERNPEGCLKLSPAARVKTAWEASAELEWIGHRRECQQLWVRFGRLARKAGSSTATTLGSRGERLHSFTGNANEQPSIAPSIDAYLYEPQPAILASRLTAALANALELTQVHPAAAYFTSNKGVQDVGLTRFKVEEVLPLDRRRLKSLLRDRSIGDVEVKKRGVNLAPERLKRELRLRGERVATLLIFPFESQTVVVVAERDAPAT